MSDTYRCGRDEYYARLLSKIMADHTERVRPLFNMIVRIHSISMPKIVYCPGKGVEITYTDEVNRAVESITEIILSEKTKFEKEYNRVYTEWRRI